MAATRIVQARERVLIDCRYGDDYWQKLDVYLPRNPGKTPLPVLVFFHGGAWTSGTKEWMGFMAPPLLALPAIFVAANYRLAPATRYPAIFQDCMNATAWVVENIAAHGGDPRRLFVGGHSAGGHLAALVALDREAQRAAGLGRSAIRGFLGISGSYDLRKRDSAAGSPERRIYDVLLSHASDDTAASPITHVRPDSPPCFVAWGTRDFSRLIVQAKAFVSALDAAGVRHETLEMAGADHFEANEACGNSGGAWTQVALRWLDSRF
jgi:acetyl esterase/lipase